MSLRGALRDARDVGGYRKPGFPVPRVRSARKYLAKKFTEAESIISAEELEVVANRLKSAVTSESLANISRRDWSKAAWCLWLPAIELAKNDAFLSAYKRHIARSNKRSVYKKLISAYLRDYNPRRPNIDKVGRFLAEKVKQWEWVWAERHSRFRLFSEDAPQRVAAAFIGGDGELSMIAEELGLTGDLLSQGMAREAYWHGLQVLRRSANADYGRVLDRILDWSIASRNLRYPGTESELADALLLPWASAGPTKDVQNNIENFLLQHFKDPRIPTTPGYKWAAVSADAKAIMLRWLVGAALEQFLQVVDKVAMPSQWQYRRAFWMAYHKIGAIDEAWVAFAWRGQRQARKSFGGNKGFGKLEGSGVASDHAVLIMKIGGLTVADWSHNGKCHIWTASRRNAPKLYQREYFRDDLVEGSSNDGVVHAGAANGTWQAKVASYIGKNTGIRLKKTDYMPRGRR